MWFALAPPYMLRLGCGTPLAYRVCGVFFRGDGWARGARFASAPGWYVSAPLGRRDGNGGGRVFRRPRRNWFWGVALFGVDLVCIV